MDRELRRCDWANRSPLEQAYHDRQWGRPVRDDKALFRMLMLEGMQAGLSWVTILRKMPALCEAFDGFDPDVLIRYDSAKEEALMRNEGIIRNRRKIASAAVNARAWQEVSAAFGSFSGYLWGFVDHQPIVNRWQQTAQVPARTGLSDRISRDLKERGFVFVGPTIVYAFMQSVGMVNDHLVWCDFRGA